MRPLGLYAFLALSMSSCGLDDYDHASDCFFGEPAKERIMREANRNRLDSVDLPASARNFYILDGGNFSGSIIYASFDCGSPEDCWSAVASLDGPEASKFQPWTASRYAVVMEGPGYYNEVHRAEPWDVRGIENGFVYEEVQGDGRDSDHQRMSYYAIDLDRNRVYYHRESGGFPPTPYDPNRVDRASP